MRSYKFRKIGAALYSYLGNSRHKILNIRIYVQFGAFLLRYNLAQLAVLLPPNLSNVIIKLLGVRFLVKAELL